MRLIFTNCYRYNPPDSDVVMMAKKLQDVFETRFARMPDEISHVLDSVEPHGKDDSGSVHSLGDTSDSEEDNESEEEREKKLKELQDQVLQCKLQFQYLFWDDNKNRVGKYMGFCVHTLHRLFRDKDLQGPSDRGPGAVSLKFLRKFPYLSSNFEFFQCRAATQNC